MQERKSWRASIIEEDAGSTTLTLGVGGTGVESIGASLRSTVNARGSICEARTDVGTSGQEQQVRVGHGSRQRSRARESVPTRFQRTSCFFRSYLVAATLCSMKSDAAAGGGPSPQSSSYTPCWTRPVQNKDSWPSVFSSVGETLSFAHICSVPPTAAAVTTWWTDPRKMRENMVYTHTPSLPNNNNFCTLAHRPFVVCAHASVKKECSCTAAAHVSLSQPHTDARGVGTAALHTISFSFGSVGNRSCNNERGSFLSFRPLESLSGVHAILPFLSCTCMCRTAYVPRRHYAYLSMKYRGRSYADSYVP